MIRRVVGKEVKIKSLSKVSGGKEVREKQEQQAKESR